MTKTPVGYSLETVNGKTSIFPYATSAEVVGVENFWPAELREAAQAEADRLNARFTKCLVCKGSGSRGSQAKCGYCQGGTIEVEPWKPAGLNNWNNPPRGSRF